MSLVILLRVREGILGNERLEELLVVDAGVGRDCGVG